jgi:prepilin-type N-terminal cleavage/methylation domain-containing protein
MNTAGLFIEGPPPDRPPSRRAVHPTHTRVATRSRRAFTILEILLAVAIFGMVIAAIYASWSAILRASRAGRDAAAEMQRTRIAARTLEDALVSTVMFAGNPGLYAFLADTGGDFGALSFVSRLPPSFPGSGYFGDQVVRRVEFTVEGSPSGESQLMLRQIPLLQTNMFGADEHAIVLAREVSAFMVEFCYQRGNSYEWVQDWRLTNQLPKLVRFALAFGKSGDTSGKPKSVTVRTVSLPCTAVPRDSQQPLAGQPGARGPGQPGSPDGLNPAQGFGPDNQGQRANIDGRFGPGVRGSGTGRGTR